MLLYILLGVVAIGVAGVIFGATMMFTGENEQIHDRLESLTSNRGRGISKEEAEAVGSVLKSPLDDVPNAIEQFVSKFLNLTAFIDQSGLKNLTVSKFVMISIGSGVMFSLIYVMASPIKSITPLVFGLGFVLPFGYVWFVRGRRLKKFAAQLPEALDLITQALRAGQSLPASCPWR